MKKLKVLIALVAIFSILLATSACGKKEESTGEQQVSEQTSAPVEATVVEAVPSPDANSTVDALLGSWVDTSDPQRFVDITKTDAGYEYKDNEGSYPATFADGVLKVKATETDTADVYIDAKTGYMVTVMQDDLTEFKKK